MSATGDSAGRPHGPQKFFLILPRVFPWQLDFYVYRLAVRNAVSENIGFAMLADIYDAAVFRIKLADSVVSCYTAVHTERGDDLVLEFSFGVHSGPPVWPEVQ